MNADLSKRVLIIAGANRCGTTSLYNYLSIHPEINPSIEKETRFFLDRDYVIDKKPSINYYNSKDNYYSLFKQPDNNSKIFFEATPDYLYSKNTHSSISECFSSVDLKLIFILRNPISRFLSWYKYDQQLENIDQESFDEYLNNNLRNEDPRIRKYFRLKNGLYSGYLRQYIDSFHEENILFLQYEDLVSNPQTLIEEVCSFTGMNPEFYSNFEFKIYNASREKDSKYIKFVKRLVKASFLGKKLKRSTNREVNVSAKKQFNIDSRIEKVLQDYYQEEYKNIANLTKGKILWK